LPDGLATAQIIVDCYAGVIEKTSGAINLVSDFWQDGALQVV